ncbi:MAG: hypothetical protein ABI668_03430 [Sphingorhabdus sp.]
MNQTQMDSFAAQLGNATGYVIVLLSLTIAGIAIGRRMGKDRDPPENVKWPGFAGFVAGLVLLAGACQAAKANESIYVFDGPAEPDYPDMVDNRALENIRIQYNQGILADAKSNGFEGVDSDISSNIAVTKFANKTVVKIYGNVVGGAYFTLYVGVVDGKRKVVSCGADKPLGEGCLGKAVEIFGRPFSEGTTN